MARILDFISTFNSTKSVEDEPNTKLNPQLYTENARKHIVHIIECYAYGSANSVALLVELAASQGHIVTIFYGERPGTERARFVNLPNVTYIKLPGRGKLAHLKNIQAVIAGLKVLDVNLPTKLHGHSSHAGVYARAAGAWLKLPVYYSPRGYAFLRADFSPFLRKLFRGIEIIMAPFGTTVACGASEYNMAQKISRKSLCIPNGLILPEDVNTQNVGNAILGAGRICHQKGFDIFKEVARAHPGLEFRWAGSPDEATDTLVQGCPKNLTLLGHVGHEQLMDEIKRCRFVLLPSRWEGMSRFLIESICYGKAVVTSTFPANRDVLKPSNAEIKFENGFSCETIEDYSAAVEYCMHDETLRGMQVASRLVAEQNYNLENSNQAWINLYNS